MFREANPIRRAAFGSKRMRFLTRLIFFCTTVIIILPVAPRILATCLAFSSELRDAMAGTKRTMFVRVKG
jgi:hypothetical protein